MANTGWRWGGHVSDAHGDPGMVWRGVGLPTDWSSTVLVNVTSELSGTKHAKQRFAGLGFERSNHLGCHVLKGSNQAEFER